MKKLLVPMLIIMVGALGAVTVLNTQFTTGVPGVVSDAVITSIGPDTFADLYQDGGYVVLDVRTEEEFDEGKLFADAKQIDYYAKDFEERLGELDRDRSYLVYCRSGNRSGKTLKKMRELGFTMVFELEGGVKAWEESGRDLVQ